MEVVDTFGFLLGVWSLERVVTDHRGGPEVAFRGRGEVVPTEGDPVLRARYEESGRLTVGAYQGTAGRRLELVRRPDATVEMLFPDGRRFVDCDLRGGLWRAGHVCGPDLHELSFRVLSADAFEERWRVTGPATDYEATTAFRRRPRGAGAAVSGS